MWGIVFEVIALMMKEAYVQVMNTPKKIDWEYAERIEVENIYD